MNQSVRAQLSATTTAGEAWRCLRCASYVPGPADATGPVRDAPRVRRGLQIRSLLILRIFAVERFLRALLFFGVAVLLWRFKHSQHSIERRLRPRAADPARAVPPARLQHRPLQAGRPHPACADPERQRAHPAGHRPGRLRRHRGGRVRGAVAGPALGRVLRHGGHVARAAGGDLRPAHKVTVTALIFLAVNLALVVYLVVTKRLLGVRGGKHAYDARLRSDSVMEKAIEAAAASASAQPATPPTTAPARQAPQSREPPQPHRPLRPLQPLQSHWPLQPRRPLQLHRPLRPPQPRSAPPPRQAPTPRHSSPPMATEPHRAHLPRPTRTPLRNQPPRRTRQPASPLLPRVARAHDPVVDVPLPTPGGTRRDIHKRSPPRLGRM